MKPLELLRSDLSRYGLQAMSIEYDNWCSGPFCRVNLRYIGESEDLEKTRRKLLRVKPFIIEDFVFDRRKVNKLGNSLYLDWYYKEARNVELSKLEDS